MNKGELKIIIFVFIIFGILSLFIILYQKNIPDDNSDNPSKPSTPSVSNKIDYIVIDNSAIFQISNNSYKQIDSLNSDDKFNIYVDNKYLGRYKIELKGELESK